jgi:hypothetical protein
VIFLRICFFFGIQHFLFLEKERADSRLLAETSFPGWRLGPLGHPSINLDKYFLKGLKTAKDGFSSGKKEEK